MTSPEQTVLAAVRTKGNFLLATHFNPDGDALGSLLGLAEILEGMGKCVLRYLEEPVPHLYRFLPGCGQIQIDMDKVREFVARAGNDLLTICLDCGDEKRLGRNSGELIGFRVLEQKETPGLGDKIENDTTFTSQFAGRTPPSGTSARTSVSPSPRRLFSFGIFVLSNATVAYPLASTLTLTNPSRIALLSNPSRSSSLAGPGLFRNHRVPLSHASSPATSPSPARPSASSSRPR